MHDAGRSVFYSGSWKQDRNEFPTGRIFFDGGNLAFGYQATPSRFLCGWFKVINAVWV